MAQWIDHKYALLLSNRFDRFSTKNSTMNFRCPYCGDSRKDKTKARGFLLLKKQEYFYYCHNCHVSRTFSKFLEEQDPGMHKEYVFEIVKDKASMDMSASNTTPVDTFQSKPKFDKVGNKPFKELKKISQLAHDHPAKRYILGRRIPSNTHYKLFYVDNGYQWAKKWLPEKFPGVFKGRDPRIVLPLVDQNGKCFGAVARSTNPDSKQRYLKLNWGTGEDTGFLYGLDSVEVEQTVYVLEGQFDSLFIPNSVAVGSMHWKLLEKHITPKKVVVVLDNEPRSEFTKSAVDSAINSGYNVCVWPAHVKEKDINDMVIAGMEPADIKQIIDTNTFSGLKAKLALSVWSK
jgi:hypothetical protein